jgi:hypothetical protein
MSTVAQTITPAINELKDIKLDKGWKNAGWEPSGGKVTIPEDYTEALIFIFARNTNSTRRVGQSQIFLPEIWGEAINNKIELLVCGYYLTGSDFGYAVIEITNNGKSFEASNFVYGGQSVKGWGYVMVYYR